MPHIIVLARASGLVRVSEGASKDEQSSPTLPLKAWRTQRSLAAAYGLLFDRLVTNSMFDLKSNKKRQLPKNQI